MPLPSNPRSLAHRQAFSLIEVLIALSLTVLLLSAVYAAVGLHLRFQTAGRAEVKKNQLLRALIRKMDEDFGSIVLFVDQSEEEDESSSVENTEDLDDVSDTALTVGGLESEGTPITFGVVGTSEYVHLCVSRPLRELTYDSIYGDAATSGRSNDLLTITYGLAPVDVAQLFDPTRPKYDPRDPNAFINRPDTGFGRREIDLYAFDAATDVLAENNLLAPEITALSFSYFDGTAWLDSWDSRTLAALPRAVRVTFGFWSPSPKKEGIQSFGVDSGTIREVEHVFNIPVSIPIIE